ncbi:MAG: glycoside hydrolase family 130 protein [Candidatus Hydrogenedentes bacterium]|nr:glycoside hydrolase family 130 protein [Candidatus Hydrogenedentota bacterium]
MSNASECVVRYSGNPILTAAEIPYPATLIFNAGVAKYEGKYVMAFRNDYGGAEGEAHFEGTNIGLAFSDDGIHWEPRPQPWIEWQTEEIRRAYDPRLTVLEGRCYLCFAVDTGHGVRGGIAVTDDFDAWEVLSLSAPDNRNMVLFPERLDGKFLRLERPFPIYGRGAPENFDLWFSDSPDCRYWGNTQLVLGSEEVPWANAKIGPGAPPVKTEAGWLTLFHAVNIDRDKELPAWHRNWHKTYTIGVMLLDLERPWVVKGMSGEPLMTPEAPYELEGFRGHVLFPGGLILEDCGELKIYYGAADTVECLATADVSDLVALCLRG